jgi:FkbM family methyltransferase
LLYRSFSWPLAKRLGAEGEVSVAGGSTVFVRTDDTIGRVLAISGAWEPNVTAVFRRCLSPGDVCLDVGAHIGYYALLASRLVGRDGHVYAFEPSPSNYRELRANLARNRAENVTALEVAAGQTSGRAVLNEGPGTNTGRANLRPVLTERDSGMRQVMVDVRPITADVPEGDLVRIRAIKVDVEGYELEVLRSLAPVLELGQRLALFLEVTPGWIHDNTSEYLEDVCRTHGFTPYLLSTGYSVEDMFPSRLEQPAELAAIPTEQCDLLLRR